VRVDVNGVGIEYEVTGDGPPVVLLHGFPDSGGSSATSSPERFRQSMLGLPPVKAPTMGVWSSEDFALTEGQMTRSAGHVAGPWRYERLDGPGHWMQLEAPDGVNRLLIDFLGT
jgi:pimeloyl-ACP methyl ester carboxylesterase